MNQKAEYYRGNNYIKEIPHVTSDGLNYMESSVTDRDLHLKKYRRIKCHEATPQFWSDGKIVIEGIDYGIVEDDNVLYAMFTESSIEEDVITEEDELWREVIMFISRQAILTDTVETLKSKYTLIKKS